MAHDCDGAPPAHRRLKSHSFPTRFQMQLPHVLLLLLFSTKSNPSASVSYPTSPLLYPFLSLSLSSFTSLLFLLCLYSLNPSASVSYPTPLLSPLSVSSFTTSLLYVLPFSVSAILFLNIYCFPLSFPLTASLLFHQPALSNLSTLFFSLLSTVCIFLCLK